MPRWSELRIVHSVPLVFLINHRVENSSSYAISEFACVVAGGHAFLATSLVTLILQLSMLANCSGELGYQRGQVWWSTNKRAIVCAWEEWFIAHQYCWLLTIRKIHSSQAVRSSHYWWLLLATSWELLVIPRLCRVPRKNSPPMKFLSCPKNTSQSGYDWGNGHYWSIGG